MCSFIVKSLKQILAKFQTNWSSGKCFAAQYQSSLTWSRDAFWANRLPNQSTPKTVLALQHPINLLLVDRFTWNFVWVSFNHLVISIQRFNEFGVKMTVSAALIGFRFFGGYSVYNSPPPFRRSLKPILGGASARVFGRTKITVKIVEALARV